MSEPQQLSTDDLERALEADGSADYSPRLRANIDEQFAAFHAKYPGVYAEIVRLCREARANGHERIGIGMLWEVMRWEALIRAGV